METFELRTDLPRLHETPLGVIRVENGRVTVEGDTPEEVRVRFVCEPYQAVRMVTIDCAPMPEGLVLRGGEIIEVRNSAWVAALRDVLQRVDHTATFLDRARHFIFPLQDDLLEVVAWDVRVEGV
jgi:hypothetical protein